MAVARAGLVPTNRAMLFGPPDETEVGVLFGLITSAVRRGGGMTKAHSEAHGRDTASTVKAR